MPMIVFEDLSKWYPLYHPVTAGLKRFLFGFPRGKVPAAEQVRSIAEYFILRIRWRNVRYNRPQWRWEKHDPRLNCRSVKPIQRVGGSQGPGFTAP